MNPESQDDDDTAALKSQIGELEAAGQYVEAIPLAEHYAEAVRTRMGEDHPWYAAALTNLAVLLLHKANRLVEAESLLRRALAIYEKSPGANQPDVAKTLDSLAQLLNDTGRVAEAEPLRRRALAIESRRGQLPMPASSGHGGRRGDGRLLDGLSEEADAKAGMKPAHQGRMQPPAALPPAGEARSPSPTAGAKRDEGTTLASFASHRQRRPTADAALEIDAGRLAYQIPRRMWLDFQETVEVRLGRREAKGLTQGFGGRGEVRAEDVPIVETMSVSLVCEPGAFDIVPRSERDQLVKPDLVLGTPFHSNDFGRWVWLVTPRAKGEHTLLVKVSAAMRDSRGLPTTSSLPDKTFAVTVRVQLVRAVVRALARAAPGLAWAVVTALVGVFTKDYWWPAIRNMIGIG